MQRTPEKMRPVDTETIEEVSPDFARGQRKMPKKEVDPDFARGQHPEKGDESVKPDYARGQRDVPVDDPEPDSDFARGQRQRQSQVR